MKTEKKTIRVVRKLQFLNNFLIKIAFLQGFARKNARLVREPTGFPNKSILSMKLIGSHYMWIFFTFCILLIICVSCSGKQTSTTNTGENITIEVENNATYQNANSENVIIEVEDNTASKNANSFTSTEGFLGLYYISSVDIIAMENADQRYMVLANDDIIGSDNFFLEIIHVKGNQFLTKSNLPLSFIDSYEFQYPRSVQYSLQYGTPFYVFEGEKGGSGTYLYLYYIEDEDGILLDYYDLYNSNPYEDEGEPPNIRKVFKCNITFRKYLLESPDSEISVYKELP